MKRKILHTLYNRVAEIFRPSNLKQPQSLLDLQVKPHSVLWFHASSVGEFEILRPLIEKFRDDPKTADYSYVITGFSTSIEPFFEKSNLREVLGSRLVHLGPAPWEPDWALVLGRMRPKLFITARYEAWPSLWVALSQNEIPLVVLGAKSRSSLRVARNSLKVLGQSLPKLHFLVDYPELVGPLLKDFPVATVECAGDPRWDQANARVQAADKKTRYRAIAQKISRMSRPLGVLGSVWPEDPIHPAFDASVVVVPHQLDARWLQELEDSLQKKGRKVHRTSQMEVAEFCDVLIVDEYGVLTELYGLADWAYVGGGFGKGVHSCIEPAVNAIPIAIGTEGNEKFFEIGMLKTLGMLEVIRTAEDFSFWLEGVPGIPSSVRESWKVWISGQFGAAQKMSELLIKRWL